MALVIKRGQEQARRALVRRHLRVRKKVPARRCVPAWSCPGPAGTSSSRSSTTSLGKTLASASTMEADLRALDGDKTAKARKVGELVAERAKSAGVDAVVFDRGGNRYHGRVAAIADGAREGGLSL